MGSNPGRRQRGLKRREKRRATRAKLPTIPMASKTRIKAVVE
jgi:hypothetical protein